MNIKKTLADVRPGGRVRLGDQAERTWPFVESPGEFTERLRAAMQQFPLIGAVRHVLIENPPTLSAQPSPGGQDALKALDHLVAFCSDDTETVDRLAGLIRTALAARQPSKQPDSVALGEATEFCIEKGDRQPVGEPVAYLDLGAGGYMDIGTDLSDEALAELPKGRHMLGIIGTYGVDGYKPAQAVDLGMQLDRYDAGLLGDGGGGDVGWWQDYIRAELDRAHEFYQDQADAHG